MVWSLLSTVDLSTLHRKGACARPARFDLHVQISHAHVARRCANPTCVYLSGHEVRLCEWDSSYGWLRGIHTKCVLICSSTLWLLPFTSL